MCMLHGHKGTVCCKARILLGSVEVHRKSIVAISLYFLELNQTWTKEPMKQLLANSQSVVFTLG